MTGAANDLTLRLDELSGNLQVLDATSAIVAEQALDRTSQVVITGTPGDDSLRVDASVPVGVSVRFDAGAGDDTLLGPDARRTWYLEGDGGGRDFRGVGHQGGGGRREGSGQISGLAFSGVEHLVGGSQRDVFDLGSGRVESVAGGAGRDWLIGPGVDATWEVGGQGAGQVAGVGFAGVEILQGAADNRDTFVLGPEGRIDLILGGDRGFDSLVMDGGHFDLVAVKALGDDLGSIDRDGDVFFFRGLEPITDDSTGDKMVTATDAPEIITISGVGGDVGGAVTVAGDLPESFAFTQPDSVTVETLGGGDEITIQALDTFAGTLTVNAGEGADVVILEAIPAMATISLDGGASLFGADRVRVTADADMTLTDTSLVVAGTSIALADFEEAELTGGASANEIDASGWSGRARLSGEGGADVLLGGSGDDELSGGDGDDRYVFAPGWGDDVVTEQMDEGHDVLDFTALDLSGPDGTLFVDDTTGTFSRGTDSVEQDVTAAERVDVTLSNAAGDLKEALVSGLQDLIDFVERLQDADEGIPELLARLPFLSRGLDGGLADVLGLTGVFDSFKQQIDDVLAGLPASPSLSTVLDEVNALMASMLPTPLTVLSVTGGYRGANPVSSSPADELELLLDFNLEAEPTLEPFEIDLGEDAENLGVSLAADISLDTRLDAHLTLGLTTGSTKEPFLAAASLGLEVEADAALDGVDVNVGFLRATLEPGSVEYGGRLTLTLQDLDNDGRITETELQTAPISSLVDVRTEPSSGGFDGLSAGFDASLVPSGQTSSGLRLPGATSDIDMARFELRLPNGIDDVFQGAVPVVSLESPVGMNDTVNWLENGGFSNITPTEVMGLLRQVLDALTAIAGSDILNTSLPFTDQTLGDVLAYATSFKTEVLDPLFQSGDLLVPDIGPDGVPGVPDGVPDFTFGSIQELSDRLSSALGLSIEAMYDRAENQVSLTLDFARALGFGSATVTTERQGGADADNPTEKQTLTLNAVDSSGFFAPGDANALADTFRLAFPDPDGVLEFTDPLAHDATAEQIRDALEALSGIGDGNVSVDPDEVEPGVFDIGFVGDLAGTDVDQLVSDATQLMGAFSVDLGTGLGDLVDLQTSGRFNLLATLDAGLTFVLDLDPSRAIQITPALPDTAADAVVERAEGAVDDSVQVLTVSNATGGSFTLSFGSGTTAPFDVDATAPEPFPTEAQVQTALEGAPLHLSIASVERTLTLNDAVYEIRFDSDPGALLTADATNLEAATDNGILSGPTASFRVTLFNREVDVVERDLHGDTVGSTTATERELGQVTVTVDRNDGNSSLDPLREQTQQALNRALAEAGLTLGFVDAEGALSTGALAVDDTPVTAPHDALTRLGSDLDFTVRVDDRSDEPPEVSGRLRAVDVLDTGAEDLQSLFDGTGQLTDELGADVDPVRLAAALEAAVNDALEAAGLEAYRVAIGTDGARLSFDVDAAPAGDTLEIRFAEPIRVEAGGGRLSLNAPPTTLTLQDLQPGFSMDRRIEVEADFADPAFQDLGIVSSPTPFDGVLADDVAFTLLVKVNDTPVSVPVVMAASETADNTSIDDLVADLQAAVNGDVNSGLGLRGAGLADGTIEAFRIDEDGNRVGLRSNVDAAVQSLSIQVPDGSNGAVTGLGFASGDGETKRAKASDFFLEDVSLEGGFAAFAADVSASAKIGFLAVTATLEPTLDASTGKFIDASIDLGLRDPLDGGTRLDVATLAEAISDGQFLFDAADVGDTNPDPDVVDPGTGFLLGSISGGVGLRLAIAPDGALAGLPADLDASLDVFIQSPDWLAGTLELDPLGFGPQALEFDGATSTTLGEPVPSGGVLTQDLRLIVSNDGGTTEAIATLLADATAGNSSAAELVDQVQEQLDLALESLGQSSGDVSVALAGGSDPALVLSGVAGLSLRGPVSFTGPDFEDVFAQLGDLTLSDLLDALEALVTFLQGSEDTPGFVQDVLQVDLPLVGLSLADLVDLGGSLSDLVDQVTAQGATSLQLFNNLLVGALGLPTARASVETLREGTSSQNERQKLTLSNAKAGRFTLSFEDETTVPIAFDAPATGPGSVEEALEALSGIGDVTVVKAVENVTEVSYTITFEDPGLANVDQLGVDADDLANAVLSFDPDTGVIDFEFGFHAGDSASRPFNLDLAEIFPSLPDFLTNLVSVGASGNLEIGADVDLVVALGLDLTGDDKALFLHTGADGTRLEASASAAASDLSFEARVGPLGLFVEGGQASLNALVSLALAQGSGRFDLLSLDGGDLDVALPGLSDLEFTFPGGIGAATNVGSVMLPLFTGTPNTLIPLGTPSNVMSVDIDLANLFGNLTGTGGSLVDAPVYQNPFLPDIDFGAIQPPSLFGLLSDPSVLVDGLERVVLSVADTLEGQIFGFDLPLISDLLQDNPVSDLLRDFQSEFLAPLGLKLAESNLNLEGLFGLLQDTLFGVFGPDGPFAGSAFPDGLLKDADGNDVINADDIVFTFFAPDPDTGELEQTDDLFFATQVQFDFDLGRLFEFQPDEAIAFDLGIPAFGIEGMFLPTVTIDFNFHFGFGVAQDVGFYFVTDHEVQGEPEPEITLDVSVDLSESADNRAELTGRLLFLALSITDGLDVNGTSGLQMISGEGLMPIDPDNLQQEEFTRVALRASVDFVDPSGDGRLTFPELIGTPLSEVLQPELSGGAVLRAAAKVDFSILDPSLANVLPAISTGLVANFVVSATPDTGLVVERTELALADISLDLGDFIAQFAGPVLGDIADAIGPLDFLLGPDGFLNKRIPLLSDLLGKTITGKDLVVAFDPKNGPKVVAVLDAIENLFFLIDLVDNALSEGGSTLVFGDLVIQGDFTGYANIDDSLDGDTNIEVMLPAGVSDIRNLRSSANLTPMGVPNEAQQPSSMGSATARFTAGVTEPGSFEFTLLKPQTIFNLLLGKPDITLFTYELPEFGAEFFFRASVPIFGPLVAFLGGGVKLGVDMGFGYDTRGLQQFLATDNPATLINGFFLNDLDANGFDRVEAFLTAEIAAGAGIDIGIAKAGVEGGVAATIDFNLSDIDADGKVRFDELAANIAANLDKFGPLAPLAIFDVEGTLEFFLRAFLEIRLLFFKITQQYEFIRLTLFDFDIPFERPSVLASQNGDTLTLNIGENAGSRLQGDTRDVGETIHVESVGDGVRVWSDQFNVPHGLGRIYTGVNRIVADGGAGDDVIDLSGLNSTAIETEIRGGDGRDTIRGGAGADLLFGDGGDDVLFGNGGDDELRGGAGNDTLDGGDAADRLFGEEGNDTLNGGPGSDLAIAGGPGDDIFLRSEGEDVVSLFDFGSTEMIEGMLGSPILDFSGRPGNLTFFISDTGISVGSMLREGAAGDDIGDFESQTIVLDPANVQKIVGGDLVDTFFVSGTAGPIVLDGGKGNDLYVFQAGADPIHATVDDQGNAWNTDNLLQVLGSPADDAITVTGGETQGSIAFGASRVDYAVPGMDANVVQLLVRGGGGDDTIRVESTAATVPVRVEGGGDDDTLVVGGGSVDTIRSFARPGLDKSKSLELDTTFGLGPLVLVGGSGHDTVVVDDSTDTSDNTGNLSAFTEMREGGAVVEVGVVSGLDMPLSIRDPDTGDVSLADGRVEFEGVEAVDVRLGTGRDVFTLGGGFDLAQDSAQPGQADPETGVDTALPVNRLGGIVGLPQTPTALLMVSGGDEVVTPPPSETLPGDIFNVIATQDLDFEDPGFTPPEGLDDVREIVSVVTDTHGDPANEVQILRIDGKALAATARDGRQGVGFFTLRFGLEVDGQVSRFQETRPLSFAAGPQEIEEALADLSLIGRAGDVPNVLVSLVPDAGDKVFRIEFVNDSAQLDVVELEARVVPLLVQGDRGLDRINVQRLDLRAFLLGGGDGDVFALNVDVTSDPFPQPTDALTENGVNAEVTLDGEDGDDAYVLNLIGGTTNSRVNVFDSGVGASAGVQRLDDDRQEVRVSDAEGGSFRIGFPDPGDPTQTNYTRDFEIDRTQSDPAPSAAEVEAELEMLPGIVDVDVSRSEDGGDFVYEVTFLDPVSPSAQLVGDGSSLLPAPDFDKLTVYGTDDELVGDLFLLRAASAEDGLAFIALLNRDPSVPLEEQPIERVNYDLNLESITIFSLAGDDEFYVDDTRAAITIESGEGDDFFQIGQLYKSRRTQAANVALEDIFTTIETTRGFVSNGISAPMTIHSGDGEDRFIVFHNLAVLTLNGGEGDDEFLVQAFALAGSQEDRRALTDLSGDAGADFIQYAVNAPVQINGGDGLDTVIVIGSEFGDDFVITRRGVFGAGLNVNFLNIEFLEVDGAEGDDRFFIQSTGEEFVTRVVGSLGTDFFYVNGDTPRNGVISNDLRGHSGILTHEVSSSGLGAGLSEYEGIGVVGISANVADNDEPMIVIRESDGFSQVVQGALAAQGGFDTYTIVLARPPRDDKRVTVGVDPPKGLVLLLPDEETGELVEVRNPSTGDASGITLDFTASNWFEPQTVRFKVDDDLLDASSPRFDADFRFPDPADIQHVVSANDRITGRASDDSQLTRNLVLGSKAPADGRLSADLELRLVVNGAAVGSRDEPIRLLAADTADNTSLDQLLVQIQDAIDARLVAVTNPLTGSTFAAGDVQVSRFQGEDRLVIQGAAAAVKSFDAEIPMQTLAGDDNGALVDLGLAARAQLVKKGGSGDLFPTPGVDGLPEGIRGRLVTITSSTDPEAVGQTRLVLEAVDANTLILNSPWDVAPLDAQYEIRLFSAVEIPNVRVEVVTEQTPTIVVREIAGSDPDSLQSGGFTRVAEGAVPGGGEALDTSGTDLIQVRLSRQPGTDETISVDLLSTLVGSDEVGPDGQLRFYDETGAEISTLSFDEDTWDDFRTIQVVGYDDLVVEGFHKADLVLAASSDLAGSDFEGVSRTLVVDVDDNDAPGVRILESDGSTDVIEFDASDDPRGIGTVLPFEDSYQVVLTRAPKDGETVQVAVVSEPTRTSRTGGIRSFDEQLLVSLDGVDFAEQLTLEFTADDWDAPQTVFVRAIDDDRVDGSDTKVFAPTLDLLNSIQGPLIIEGGEGADRTGLLEREPVKLPGETNFKASFGAVIAASEATNDTPATITIDADDLPPELFLPPGETPADFDPGDLVDRSLEITQGPAKNKVRIITDARVVDVAENLWQLDLDRPWLSPFTGDASVPDATSRFTIFETNPNLLVEEIDQVDRLIVDDSDNVNSFDDPALEPGTNAFGEGELFFDPSTIYGDPSQPLNRFRIVGLGMGRDRVIAAGTADETLQPGGISFDQVEQLEIQLGPGNNAFTIEDTPTALTTLDTGAGDDVVRVKRISQHTLVNLGAGSDRVDVHNDSQRLDDLLGLLTLSGDVARVSVETLAQGSSAEGNFIDAADEIQRIRVEGTGGSFRISLAGQRTGALAHDVGAEELQQALETLVRSVFASQIPASDMAPNVEVSRTGSLYRVRFVGHLAGRDIPLLGVDDGELTNGLGASDSLSIDDTGFGGDSSALLTSSLLTGLDLSRANEIQTIVLDADAGRFRLSLGADTTQDLAWDITPEALEERLVEDLGGILAGDVAVTRNDDVLVVRFQGNLSQTDVPKLVGTNVDLTRIEELPGGEVVTLGGSVQVHERDGREAPVVNDLQALTVDADSGSFRLSLFAGDLVTDPIPFDASAEQVRDALQRGGESIGLDPLKFDVSVDRYGDVYLIGFQGVLRTVDGGLGVDRLAVTDSTLGGGAGASVATRMDGIGYYGFEQIDLHIGDGNQVLNVQGTTSGSGGFSDAGGVAVTNVTLGAGDEQIFVSSDADLDFESAPGFDFLTGHLHDVNGALNLDVGSGRHQLMISDEASEIGDAATGDNVDGTPVIITDDPQTLPLPPQEMGFDPDAEIWVTGLAGRGDLPEGGISYKAAPDGNFYDGIFYWSGSGDDDITIDGTHLRRTPDPDDADRTMTLLNTGMGDDRVVVSLDLDEDGFFSLNTMGGGDPNGGPVDDDDSVDASGSTLPLVFFGGLGNDDFTGGQNRDILFGDFGRVQFVDPETGEILAVLGFGGRGDLVSPLILDPNQVLDPTWVLSRALTLGGSDVLQGHLEEDILIGGADGDLMDGDEGDDLLFGDAVRLERRQGDITQGRFQALRGSVLYDRTDLSEALLGAPVPNGDDSGRLLVDGQARSFRSRDGEVPSWAEYRVVELYHSAAIENGLELVGSFGDDYMAGGADDDMLFGQLGDDVIQGDGSIESALGETPDPVGAERVPDGQIELSPSLSVDSPGELVIRASQEASSDGDDYIEGGGGDDVVFGNLGQDDIVGGSSSFFSLVAPELRPDGADLIFGGSGQRIDANHLVDVGNDADRLVLDELHARDSDAIAGDNANIYRVVGIQGSDGGGFLEFQYDQGRGAQRVLVRGVELLDYTPGGPDFQPDLFPPGAAPLVDIGAGDELHGESGDDFVYGMVGRDVAFGDSEDDDLIGGWGADWISGGTGSDGVIGDDGRISTGRYVALGSAPDPSNPAHYAELLNGVLMVDQVDKLIRTPGDIQKATINEAGALFKQVDLTPFNLTPNAGGAADDFLFEPLFADDIIFGGLGDDFLHGGSGDDAISGAEALAAFFLEPVNPGDALRFDATRIEFADYDENVPRTKLEPFFLNFAADSGGLTDEDAIFGDLGNDWIVGGPDNDHLYGGFGADLLNADDVLETNGGLNDMPDGPDYEIQDLAFGGAGRDVLIANTGGDRLIDWAGEFNSYLVPFAPFGLFTVSRGVPPHLFEFLYDLSAADGADPTRAMDTGSDLARNGEPAGELGLVTQRDAFWQDQTGAPIDPQPGNIPGGSRLTLRGLDFNSGAAQGFSPDTGGFAVQGGRLQIAPEILGADAAAVLHVGEYLPGYFEIAATINAGKPTAGLKSNAYLIFDYQSPTDFKFAGVNISIDKIQMGHRDEAGWHVDVQTPARLKPDTDYQLLLALNGLTATLVVDGQQSFSYAFAPRIDAEGFTHGLNEGMVGLGADNSVSRIDDVSVRILQPEITFEHQDDFSDGVADGFVLPQLGDWGVVDGHYLGTPDSGPALSTFDLRVGPNSLLDLEGNVSADGLGGFFFDAYSDHDYKFAGVLPDSGQVVIGHWSKSGEFRIDASADIGLELDADFDLDVSLKGTTVSVAVDGHPVLGHVFNAVVTDGAFGVLGLGGEASFDAVRFRTDDMAFLVLEAQSLVAASAAAEPVGPETTLTAADLKGLVDAAIARWEESLGLDAGSLARLGELDFRIADLEGNTLGQAAEGTIWIDADAAGHGWFVDATPLDDAEYHPGRDGALLARRSSPAAGSMDLLSVLTHELGHALGVDPHQTLGESLEVGSRVIPEGAPAHPRTAKPSAWAVRVLAAEWRGPQDDDEDEGGLREILLDRSALW